MQGSARLECFIFLSCPRPSLVLNEVLRPLFTTSRVHVFHDFHDLRLDHISTGQDLHWHSGTDEQPNLGTWSSAARTSACGWKGKHWLLANEDKG